MEAGLPLTNLPPPISTSIPPTPIKVSNLKCKNLNVKIRKPTFDED
jgi:hypothetical protein